MRVIVIGPGAVGLLWAAKLHQAGEEVGILDYRPERAALLQEQGIVLADGRGETLLRPAVTADPSCLGQADLALVCVKAYKTAHAAEALAANLGQKGRALTLQNGVGNVEALCRAVGPERVLGGITSEGSTLLGPGKVRHAGKGQTNLGPAAGGLDDFTFRVAEMLNRAGFKAEAAPGAENLIWTKLLINVGINALTAILNVPNGKLLEMEAAGELMARAVAEAEKVGLALGRKFLHEDMLEAVRGVARNTSANISSMLQDVRAGRRTEVEFINGAVVRLGSKAGVSAPVNQTLTGLVLCLEPKGGS